ncbi:Uncharacterized protein M6B38_223835 [Iris pallida]|uniref:Uncharacterized protein n=1 Tax=Iris pallida TaxID=29817 RepID=A0AAX6DVZ5_IRIPA|nr:Uncharacterized protein M6B38_223835 [Iris pallida]
MMNTSNDGRTRGWLKRILLRECNEVVKEYKDKTKRAKSLENAKKMPMTFFELIFHLGHDFRDD